MSKIKNNAIGCFVGGAVGDALGAPIEFKEQGTFHEVTGYRASPHFQLNDGEWTDDTIMAVCMAESIIENGCYETYPTMRKYNDWKNNGYASPNGSCFDIGIQTLTALNDFATFGMALPTDSEGNGTIMRLAPAVILSLGMPDQEAASLFRRTALDTHNNKMVADVTSLFGFTLRNLMYGFSVESAVNCAAQNKDEEKLLFQITHNAENIKNSGWILSTFTTAWNCFTTTQNFQDAVLKAVNFGGDADTIGSVTGQLAGAYYGLSEIPKNLVNDLYKKDEIIDLSTRILNI